MLAAIDEGQVNHVLTYHPDRLMRQPPDLEALLARADENRITLHGEAGGRDLTNPDDRFILRIEVAHACRSSDDTSRRLLDDMADRATDGRPHTGIRRYGYDKTGMHIDKDEAEVVEWVFARYLNGATARGIAEDLNWLGITAVKGGPWSGVSVRSLLDSHHVAGLRVFRGEEIGPGTWPAIIDEGMYREVQERRSYRAAAHKAKNEPKHGFYMLRSLVWCKRCAQRMAGSSIGNTQSFLCGGGAKSAGGCGRRISAPVLDKFVADAAIRLLEKLDITGQAAATTLSPADVQAIADDREQLAELNTMWAKKEITTSELKKMKKVIEDRMVATQRKIIVRPAAEVLRGMVGPDARASWEALEKAGNYERLNALFRFLFAAVRIDESTTRGRRIDYGRISIEPNPLT